MAKLTAIRQGVADALNTIPGINASPLMRANPYPPAAHVFPNETQYHGAMGAGLGHWYLTVQVFVSTVTDDGAQETLDEMLAPSGPYSVVEVLEKDSSLGGIVDDLIVESCTGYRTFARTDGGDPLLGAEWRVHVLATGD